MCAIMQALNYVGCLKSTQKASSGNAGRDFSLLFEESLQHIREAPKDLNTGEYLYPLGRVVVITVFPASLTPHFNRPSS